MLQAISVGAANFGIPGMVGKFKTAKASAMLTNMETAMVPAQPASLPCQINHAKIMVKTPNAMV